MLAESSGIIYGMSILFGWTIFLYLFAGSLGVKYSRILLVSSAFSIAIGIHWYLKGWDARNAVSTEFIQMGLFNAIASRIPLLNSGQVLLPRENLSSESDGLFQDRATQSKNPENRLSRDLLKWSYANNENVYRYKDGWHCKIQKIHLERRGSLEDLVIYCMRLGLESSQARVFKAKIIIKPPALSEFSDPSDQISHYIRNNGFELIDKGATQSQVFELACECCQEIDWANAALVEANSKLKNIEATIRNAPGNPLLEPSLPSLYAAKQAIEGQKENIKSALPETQKLTHNLYLYLQTPADVLHLLQNDFDGINVRSRFKQLRESFQFIVDYNENYLSLSDPGRKYKALDAIASSDLPKGSSASIDDTIKGDYTTRKDLGNDSEKEYELQEITQEVPQTSQAFSSKTQHEFLLPDIGCNYVIIDLETTGKNLNEDRIVEIALLEIDFKGNEVFRWETTINPGIKSHPRAIKKHKLSYLMLQKSPSFDVVAPYLSKCLHGKMLIGHNLHSFDAKILQNEFNRSDQFRVDVGIGVDTLPKSKKGFSLDALRSEHSITLNAHHAMADVETVLELLRRQHLSPPRGIRSFTLLGKEVLEISSPPILRRSDMYRTDPVDLSQLNSSFDLVEGGLITLMPNDKVTLSGGPSGLNDHGPARERTEEKYASLGLQTPRSISRNHKAIIVEDLKTTSTKAIKARDYQIPFIKADDFRAATGNSFKTYKFVFKN